MNNGSNTPEDRHCIEIWYDTDAQDVIGEVNRLLNAKGSNLRFVDITEECGVDDYVIYELVE